MDFDVKVSAGVYVPDLVDPRLRFSIFEDSHGYGRMVRRTSELRCGIPRGLVWVPTALHQTKTKVAAIAITTPKSDNSKGCQNARLVYLASPSDSLLFSFSGAPVDREGKIGVRDCYYYTRTEWTKTQASSTRYLLRVVMVVTSVTIVPKPSRSYSVFCA